MQTMRQFENCYTCEHFSLWVFFLVGSFPCEHFSLWAFFLVGSFPCGHFSLCFFFLGIFPVTNGLVCNFQSNDCWSSIFQKNEYVATVTSAHYREMSSSFLLPKLEEVNHSDVWFQQDGATTHTVPQSLQRL